MTRLDPHERRALGLARNGPLRRFRRGYATSPLGPFLRPHSGAVLRLWRRRLLRHVPDGRRRPAAELAFSITPLGRLTLARHRGRPR